MTKAEMRLMTAVHVLLLIVMIIEFGFTGYAFFYLPDTMVIIGLCCMMLTMLGYLVIEKVAKS